MNLTRAINLTLVLLVMLVPLAIMHGVHKQEHINTDRRGQ